MRKINVIMLSLLLSAGNLPALAAKPIEGIECYGSPDLRNHNDPYKSLKDGYRRAMPEVSGPGSGSVNVKYRKRMLAVLDRELSTLCGKRLALNSAVTAFSAKASQSKATDNGGCLPFSNNDPLLKDITAKASAYERALAKSESIYEREFKRQSAAERAEINKVIAITAPSGGVSLGAAHVYGWGYDLRGQTSDRFKRRGFFSKVLLQISQEKSDIKKYLDPQKNVSGIFGATAKACTSVNTGSIDKKPFDKAPHPEPRPEPTGLGDGEVEAGKGNTGTYDEAPGGGKGGQEKGGEGGSTGEEFPPAPPPPGPADTGDGGGTTMPPPAPTEAPAQSGGLGGWASNHKGALLVGAGAAAVVGGVLLYKHNQDKKKADEEDIEIGAIRNTMPGSTGGTSTSTDTSTRTTLAPAGATLQVAGFPTEATANVPVGPIVVRVIGADGAALADNGIEITLACTSSCGISGTLTKTTVGGKVEFGGILFTSAGSGVQLRVSSPGINSVASPGSFTVHEAAD